MWSPTTLSHLIGALYSAAATPEEWPCIVDLICHATGAASGFVVAVDEAKSPALYTDVGFDPDFQAAYQGMFRSYDITLQRFLEAGEHRGGWAGERQSLIPDRELETSLFYNEFMRPRDIYHQAGINLGRTGKYSHAGLSLLRSKASGEFGEQTVRLLGLLASHFRQGFLLHQRMMALGCSEEMLNQLGESECAIAAIDERGNIMNQTHAFDEVLQRREGLIVKDGRLQALEPEENKKLQRLMKGASQVGSKVFDLKNGAPPGGAMLVSQRLPRRSLQVVVNPLHAGPKSVGGDRNVVVFLIDPELKPLSRGAILKQLYRLTPSETKLIDWLVQGLDVKQTAERMHITENSARSLLKCVFSKTGMRSQSAMMRMVLRLPRGTL